MMLRASWRSRAAVRVAVLTAGLLFGAMIVLGGAAVAVTYTILERRLDGSITRATDELVNVRKRQGPAALIAAIRQRERIESDSVDIALFGADGHWVAGRRIAEPAHDGWSDMLFPDPVEGGDPTRVMMVRLDGGERLMVAGNRRPLLIVRSAVGWLFLAAAAIVTILCVAVGVLLARYLDRRLSPITTTAGAILEGELTRRVPERGRGDEFDHVARSLNLMLDRIAGLVANLRQISSDLAHDLRTPLTRIRNGLEMAAAREREYQTGAVQIAIAQIDDVVLMFDAILRIAEIDGTAGRDMRSLALGEIAHDIVETMAPAFAEHDIDLVYREAPGSAIRADRLQIAAALINLLENVLRHAPGSYRTDVVVGREDEHVTLTVRDTGPGVPDDHLDQIFDRFVRLDRSRSTEGHGLGLSLVRSVAQAHGARLRAMNVEGGLSVTLAFPADAPDEHELNR